MTKAKNEDIESFNELMRFGNNFEVLSLRHDRIENGIFPDTRESAMYLTACNMALEGGTSNNFDVMFETNTKTYLTQCLAYSHTNNSYFQNEMNKIFNNYDNCIYQSAPVKLYDRCVIKSTNDYKMKPYPSVANIIDFYDLV